MEWDVNRVSTYIRNSPLRYIHIQNMRTAIFHNSGVGN